MHSNRDWWAYCSAQTFCYCALVQTTLGRRDSQAENEHGTIPFILTMGVTLSCVRDDWAWLSLLNTNTARDVKLTYLSGTGGRLL